MRIISIAVASLLAATAVPAVAEGQWGDRSDYRQYQRAVQQQQRECRRDLRRADTRRERIQAQRECQRELRQIERAYRRSRR